MDAPLIYVIVINWNGREHLDACYRSLLESPYPNAVFLLVDNASTDGSVAYIEKQFGGDARVEVLALDKNLGWSGGNNAGIRRALAAGATYIFLLNNDTATDPAALQYLADHMERRPEAGALAPRMVMFDQPEILNSTGLRLSTIGAAWDIGIGRIDSARWHTHDPVAGVCGGACFLRAAVLEATGLLPEDFEIYLDDLDLCLRIWEAGYTVEQCPEAVVRHKYGATMGVGARARRKYYLNTRNRFRIILRHFPLRRIAAAVPWLVLGELRAIGSAIRSGAPWRIMVHLQAWVSTMAYLPAALRFRRARQSGGAIPAYWQLVRRTPMFCPALELPEAGWYPPLVRDGRRLRPMARRATVATRAGTLHVSLVNCYPSHGDARIALYLNGHFLGALRAAFDVEACYTVEEGQLAIVAESIFEREATDAPADTGAWLQLDCNGHPLI